MLFEYEIGTFTLIPRSLEARRFRSTACQRVVLQWLLMDMQEAFKLFNEGLHLKVKVGGTIYDNVLIKSLDSGSGSTATVTLVLPTRIGEPTRFGNWRLDEVEVLQ